jgi:hypothetical protein
MSTMNRLKYIIFAGVLLVLTGCKRYYRNQSHASVQKESIREGEALAKVYCQSCHMLPDPALLDAKSWEKGVLPGMGPRLGIFHFRFEKYVSSIHDTNIGPRFYPSRPLLTDEEWGHIIDYYTATSPDSLAPAVRPKPIKIGLPLFKAEAPAFLRDMPATCLTRMDPAAGRGLWVFDVHYGDLSRWSPALQLEDSFHITGGIVDLDIQDSILMACNIGLLVPNNEKFGKVQRVSKGKDGKMHADSSVLFDHLARPVQVTAADFNQDGRTDYLVCEFGNLTGSLSWLENKGEGHFERHVIRAVAGAIRAYVDDYDHDGRPDIWALFAQGEEGIFLFTNKGGGAFKEQSILKFPPMYGSTYFEFADLNKDGLPDILYTCGDNADYSPVLKPYHGVYIFLNEGNLHFSQRYFFPIDGCYKAMARDFDGDGDLDIATISFFPDTDHHPEEGFVYFEHLGGMDFQPYSLNETQQGKWLTMDAGDLDGDGRPDLVLGNFSFFSPVTKAGVDFKKGPPFLLLRNRGK